MKKVYRYCALITCALLIAALLNIMTVSAAASGSSYSRINDRAELLTSSEREKIEKELDEVSEKHQCDVMILTVDSLNGYSPNALADDYFDYGNFGYGTQKTGILFLISMEYRDWAISTTGDAKRIFTDAGQEYMTERIVPYLSKGDYAGGFSCYAKLCDRFITQAEKGDPYDINNMPKGDYLLPGMGISALIGAIISFITTGVMKGQLKTVRSQDNAKAYVKPGGFQVGVHSDVFLYDHVTRVRKPKEPSHRSSGGGGSTIHMGSSGTSHGGSHGKF